MLKFIEKHANMIMYKYHHNMAKYCYGKVDMYGPEDNDYWGAKVLKHVSKEFEFAMKLIQEGES